MADAEALCNRFIRPRAHCHPFCSPSEIGQCHKMRSNATEEKESDSDDDRGSATKDAEERNRQFSSSKVFRATILEKQGTRLPALTVGKLIR